jgi:hypothetical protein
MAVLRVPETQARDLAVGPASGRGHAQRDRGGHVRRIDPAVQQGAVAVEVALDGSCRGGRGRT